MGSTSPRPHTVGTPSSSSSSNFDTNAYLNLDLTPRTKVQAMLAALDDDDSDKENLTKSTRQESPLKSSKATPRFQKKFQPQPTSGSSKHDSDDSDVPHARRGTFAARMQNLPDASKGTGKSGESEEEHTLSAGQPLVNNGSAVTEYGVGIAEDDNTASGPRFVSPGLPDDQSQDAGSLFVSPEKERTDGNQALEETSSPSRSPNISTSNNVRDRLQALVARRRRELSEKESELQPDTLFSEEEEVHGSQSPARSTKRARTPLIFDSSESEGDPEVSKKLTQQARPTRKASKKAIEQMHRETQRMSRNMQLTHEARTKVKFTTESLFAKFNFRQQQPAPHVHSELPDGSSSANTSSDAENRLPHDTPPSSPPSRGGSEKGGNGPEALSVERDILQSKTARQSNSDDESDGLLDLNKLLTQKRSEPSSKASQDTKPLLTQQKLSDVTVRRASVRRFAKSVAKAPILADSDDELEIVAPNKTSRLRIFDTIPTTKAKESGSLHALRALAHLNESDRKRNKNNGTMTPSELQSLLRRRAREQAMRERDEKIQRLREKGIVVQTEEEKEHEQMEIESMLEKARKEAYDLAKKEKEEARREGKEVPDMDDSDDDEDYGASDEEELDFSGSEDEDEDEDEDENKSRLNDDEDELGKDLDSKTQPSDLLDEEASESEGDDEDEDEEDPEEGADSSDGDASPATFVPRQNKRRRVLLSDDEDDEDDELALVEKSRATETNPGPSATPSPTKTAVSPTKDAFGFNNARPSALDLSQVFAGTMAEEQTQADLDTQLDTDSQQDSMAFLRGLPDPELPNYEDSLPVHSPVVTSLMVQDSQSNASPIRRNGHSQLSGPVNFETQTQRANAETQVFEMPEPTQDDGFHIGDSQPVLVDGSTATVDTVLIEQPLEVSDHTKKSRGRLQRGERFNATAEDAYDELSPVKDVDEGQVLDAFTKMRQERTKAAKAEAFNKKQSEAKAMFEEQAEESEDEYAGLGGASDDESQGELDEETKKMIDDQSNEAINERDIAAFYAEKERLADEKGIEKLYKDVINGGLRRKRGAQDDLFDSDDEDEAAARRRAAKQREFAKMRKALLADEKIGKIAANPKQAAFLQAIEDRDEDDDFDFLESPNDGLAIAIPDSQDESSNQQPLSAISANIAGTKRKFSETSDASQQKGDMPPPPNPRRAKTSRLTRPTSLADIRNTLSEIIGEPESIFDSQHTDSDSPDESDHDMSPDKNVESRPHSRAASSFPSPPPEQFPRNPRRTQSSDARTSVIDRIALKKRASTFTITARSASDATGSRLAFHNPASSSAGFKAPSLLRRATTNNSIDSNSSAGSFTAPGAPIGGLGGKDAVKRGGTAKSSVNYYVREMERKAKLEKVEQERSESRLRVGKMRRDALAGKGGASGAGLGWLVGGEFE